MRNEQYTDLSQTVQEAQLGAMSASVERGAEPKHHRLIRNVNILANEITLLADLVSEISNGNGVRSDPDDGVEPESVPLVECLINEPDRIEQQCERLSKLKHTLREMLL